MNHPPRMPRTVEDDRGPMFQYKALLELAKNGPIALDLDRHRYKATVKGICIGYFSSLSLAMAEVDQATPILRNSKWEAPDPVPDSKSHVIDVARGTVYVRVVQGIRPVAEEQSETTL